MLRKKIVTSKYKYYALETKLKQSLSSSSLFGICIWGDSIQRPPLETRKKDMLYFTCDDLELGLSEKARA